jgi:hypothetical protein
MKFNDRSMALLGIPDLPPRAFIRKAGGGIIPQGGGGSSPTSTATQTTGLPSWALPYAQNTLAKQAALSDRPYEAYGAERIAGFSPLQEQAKNTAAGMQTSGATGAGIGLAGMAGLGGLNTQNFGSQQAQQYMSPYIQNVVDIGKREAQRQSSIQGTQQQAQAAQAGAFGGSRDAIMRAERERNLGTQMGDIQAQGNQMAYTNAQQQFNADQARGLQGLGIATNAAGQLGQLGGQQFQQGMDINKLQGAYGAQEQGMKQRGLDLAYQDFQNQQNYPQQQLGYMANMINGLPLGKQSTTQMYEADPGFGSQIVGLGQAAYGLSKFFADGGSITSDATVSEMLEDLTDEQLQQSRQIAEQSRDKNRIDMIDKEIARRAQVQPALGQGGIASATSDEMMDRMLPTEASMARGGIVAFAAPSVDNNYSLVTDEAEEAARRYTGSGLSAAQKVRLLARRQEQERQIEAAKKAASSGMPYIPFVGQQQAVTDKIVDTSVAPAASPVGLGDTPEAKKAAVLPPDIGAERERPAMTTAAPTGGKDLMQVQEDIFNRMKKLDKGDPYAAQIEELGKLSIKQKEDEKTALLADQAKFATAYDGREKRLDARKADITKREDQNVGMAFMRAGFTTMSTPGGLAKAIGKGALVGTEAFASGLEKIQTAKDLLDKSMDDLEDLRLNRSEMSAKEIRSANSNISGARIEAKKLTIAGLKEAGAKTDAKAGAIVDATFKQMQSREASAAADRRATTAANRPSETERMMNDIGAIASGKSSYGGKTGAEGVQLYKENRAAVSGVRYAGPTKAAAYTPGDAQLVKGLADQVSLLSGNTDPKNVARVKVLEDKIAAIDRKYAGAGGAGAASNKPSQDAFMEAARKANPDVSDAELEAYYADKYK